MPEDEHSNTELQKAAWTEEAKAELAKLRTDRRTTGIFDLENDPDRRHPISISGPDEEILAAMLRNKARDQRLAQELPDKPESIEIHLPKPLWEMKLQELEQWYERTLNYWRDRAEAASIARKWTSEQERDVLGRIRKRIDDVLISQLPEDNYFRKRYQGTEWDSVKRVYQTEEYALVDAIHEQVVESAVDKGLDIPEAIYYVGQDAKKREKYAKMKKKSVHNRVFEQEKVKIDKGIKYKILQNFRKICNKHFHDAARAIAEFENLIPECDVREDKGAYIFTDKKTKLAYIALQFNIYPNRIYTRYFDLSKGINYPVRETREVSVLVKENPTDPGSDWVILERGKIEQ